MDRTTDSPCASAHLRVRPARRSAGESVAFLAAEYIPVGAPLPFDSRSHASVVVEVGSATARHHVSASPRFITRLVETRVEVISGDFSIIGAQGEIEPVVASSLCATLLRPS